MWPMLLSLIWATVLKDGSDWLLRKARQNLETTKNNNGGALKLLIPSSND